MRYAKVIAAKKSYCDRPNPFFTTLISATDEEYDREIENTIHGCEDFDIWELTESEYYDEVHAQASKEEKRLHIKQAIHKYNYMVG